MIKEFVCKNIFYSNFTYYYFESLSIKNNEYLQNFLIYNPIINLINAYITI